MTRRLILLVFAALLLWPLSAAAQSIDPSSNDDVLIRINGPITVPADQTLNAVIGISNDVIIDGAVSDTVVLIDSNATINGQVDGDVIVISGTLTLGPASTVKNVELYSSDLVRDPAATITGDLTEESGFAFNWWDSLLFSFYLWLSSTVIVLVAGLIFALVGSKQLMSAAMTVKTRTGQSIVTALVLFIGLPGLAIAAFLTVIGIPLSIAILIFVMPVLWFIGYLVIGAWLGLMIRKAVGRQEGPRSLVWSTLIGLLALQLIAIIPFIGGMFAFLGGLLGIGALVYNIVRDRGGHVQPALPGAATPVPAD